MHELYEIKARKKGGWEGCLRYTIHGQRTEQEAVFPAALIDPVCEVAVKRHGIKIE